MTSDLVTGRPVPRWALAAWSAEHPTGAADAGGIRAAWGFDHETWLLGDGKRRLVVQRRSDRSDPTRPRACRIRAAVRSAGLPVPESVLTGRDAGHVVVTLPFVEGRPGSELLADDTGAEAVGRLCGGTAARLAGIDPAGLGLPATWSTGARLRSAGLAWTRRCGNLLDAGAVDRLAALLEAGARATDATPAGFAHGDLAPVNVLVRGGALAAVLDLDRARVAHPVFDSAWFSWVVGYHHPEVAGAAWRGYAAAAGLPAAPPAAFAWLQPLQLLERAAGATRAAERARWLERLGAMLDGSRPG